MNDNNNPNWMTYFSVSLPKPFLKKVDNLRGDIPRSRFLRRTAEIVINDRKLLMAALQPSFGVSVPLSQTEHHQEDDTAEAKVSPPTTKPIERRFQPPTERKEVKRYDDRLQS